MIRGRVYFDTNGRARPLSIDGCLFLAGSCLVWIRAGGGIEADVREGRSDPSEDRSPVLHPICRPANAPMGFLILGLVASILVMTASAQALPMPSTSTDVAIFRPISNPLCAPWCASDPTFSTVAVGSNYFASASASYGSVGAQVTIHEDAFGGSRRFLALAESYMLDNITITGPTGTGSIRFEVGLHGTASTTLPGIVDPDIQFVFIANSGAAGSRIQIDSQRDGFPSTTFTSPDLAYNFGDPITINMILSATLLQFADVIGTVPLIADVGYGSTASVTGFTVLDEQGLPVNNYSIQSQSGAVYPVVVPEPGTACLLLGGLLLLLCQRRT